MWMMGRNWIVGKKDDGTHYESQTYSNDEEKSLISNAIKEDAKQANINITIIEMTSDEYKQLMSQ